jgi:MFS family permease
MTTQFSLLADRRYAPLFITQCLGAFNDNLVKTMLVVLIAYGYWNIDDARPDVLVSMAAGLFILPFVLFCPLAGELTEKYPKDAIIRIIKLAEIGIVLLAAYAFFSEAQGLALAVIFLLGAHSAFFSPGKFSILPQHLSAEELIAANGLTSTGTYLAILGGTIAGAVLAPMEESAWYASIILMAAALAGYIASRYIPPAPPATPLIIIHFNPIGSLIKAIGFSRRQKNGVFAAMLGIAWFYFVAATFHAQFPNFAKESLHVDTHVLTAFMVIFSGGIALGGLLNNSLLAGKINPHLVPWASAGLCLLSAILYTLSAPFITDGSAPSLTGITDFFTAPRGIMIGVILFLLSVAGGLYVVPLRAIVQHRTAEGLKGKVIAANSLLDALLMLLSSVMASSLLSAGLAIEELFLIISGLTAFTTILLWRTRSLYEDQN